MIAFGSWTYVAPEVWERFKDGYKVQPQDHGGGDVIWGMDMIAPFGHMFQLARLWRDKLHRDHPGCKAHFRRNYGTHIRFGDVA